mmetsp:Transcript_36972/g.40851  ORF Transcript_36972/g.40851 Transcript_36972/m.40851 type:complete len:80 (-) Transcript_36972:45-284(-)
MKRHCYIVVNKALSGVMTLSSSMSSSSLFGFFLGDHTVVQMIRERDYHVWYALPDRFVSEIITIRTVYIRIVNDVYVPS